MKNERDVKKRVKRVLDSMGAWYYMPVQTGYGVAGVPDFIACTRGRFVAIETKFKNNTPTPLQQRNLAAIAAKGGVALVVNEANIEELAGALDRLL